MWNIARLSAVALALCSTQAAPTTTTTTTPDVKQVYQFPYGTWLENIAVRSNGDILTTLLNNGTLVLLPAPDFDAPRTLANLSTTTPALLGITELEPDVFGFLGVNFSLTTGVVPGTTFYKIDLNEAEPCASVFAELPQVPLGNGLTSIPGYALLSDSTTGVTRVDLATGAASSAIDDPLFAAPPGPDAQGMGVNGIRASADAKTLYFVNTGSGVVGSVPLAQNGSATGPARAIATVGPADDLAVAPDGTLYVTGSTNNTFYRVDPDGQFAVIAGNKNSTEIAGSTSAAFGRAGREDEVFVVTGGGQAAPINGTVVVGGQVISIKV